MKDVSFRGRLKFLGQIGVSTQQDQIAITPGKYSGLFIILSGTNDTGDDYTFADNGGRVRVMRSGGQIVNMALGFLSDWSNARGGATDNSSTTAGAVQQSAVIPFQSIVPNALVFEAGKSHTCHIDLGSGFADLASGSVQLYAIQSNDIQRYVPDFYDHTEAAFSGNSVYRFPTPNLLEVWGVGATAANVANLQLSLDGEQVEDADYVAQHTFANFLNQVETGLTYFNLSPIDSGDLREGLADNTQLKINNSASTAVTLYIFSFRPSDALEASISLQNQVLNKRQSAIVESAPVGSKNVSLFKKAVNTR